MRNRSSAGVHKDLSHQLADRLGPKGWLTSDLDRYETDWSRRFTQRSLGVAAPDCTDDVVSVLRLASQAGVPVTPQGGNTGLCGASVPIQPNSIILSLLRMNRITKIDPLEMTISAQAGVVLGDLHKAVAAENMMFPMHLGSEGTAQIGGLINTNAGGSHAMRYGMMQDLVLGLEVVLPNGSLWHGMRAFVKDNSGYQLRKLFCGAEGTLGIVTNAVLRLFPKVVDSSTALLAISDLDRAISLASKLRASLGPFVSSVEFFSDTGLGFVLKHVDAASFPLTVRSNYYLLVELTSSAESIDTRDMMVSVLSAAHERNALEDGVIAANEGQRQSLWRLREEMPEGQRREGAQLKHDISLPLAKISEFLLEAERSLHELLPGVRVNAFGHLCDGNIHFNLSPPVESDDFSCCDRDISDTVHSLVEQMGGSFAAEHGLGRTKRDTADRLRSDVERNLMRSIKCAVDPSNTLNPGVLVAR